jgi:hypothetical protein
MSKEDKNKTMRFDVLALVVLGLYKLKLIKSINPNILLSQIQRLTTQIILLPDGYELHDNPALSEQLSAISQEIRSQSMSDDIDHKIAFILDDIATARKKYTQEEIEKILKGMYA